MLLNLVVNNFNNNVNNLDTYSLSFIGISYVFLALLFLSFFIYILKFINKKENEKNIIDNNTNQSKILNTNSNVSDDEEIVAIITASISHKLKNKNFIIKSIKPFSENMKNWNFTNNNI
jgi:sodium pump decarboxylase gamma subunit